MPTESDFNQHISERTDKALRHAARRALVRDTNRDYWLKLKGDKATAAMELIETTTAHEPETAQEWIDLPLPLLKAAAVADSGLDVRGVALLRDECWDRAKVMEPGRFGNKPAPSDDSVSIPAADLLKAAVALAMQSGLGAQMAQLLPRDAIEGEARTVPAVDARAHQGTDPA